MYHAASNAGAKYTLSKALGNVDGHDAPSKGNNKKDSNKEHEQR